MEDFKEIEDELFEYLEKESTPKIFETSLSIVIDKKNKEHIVWLPKEDWDIHIKGTALDYLTEEELKLLNLEDGK
jgi:hypothetical protein